MEEKSGYLLYLKVFRNELNEIIDKIEKKHQEISDKDLIFLKKISKSFYQKNKIGTMS